MSIYSKRINIPLPAVIAAFFLALILVFYLASIFLSDKKFLDKEGILWLFAVGAVPGLVVALAQFILSWSEFNAIGRIKNLGIKNVLLTRDDANYYGELIEKAKDTIVVMGVTAKRFLEDFADESSPLEHKKRLLAALNRNVTVKILITTDEWLDGDQKTQYQYTKRRCLDLKSRFPGLFDGREFNHAPNQSLVRIDNDVIVGPVFDRKASKDTPAIHISVESGFAKSYLFNFDQEWEHAQTLGAN